MDPIDPKQAQRVWSRVMAAQAAGAESSAAPEVTGGEVLAMLQKECETAATYRHLAARQKGQMRACLLRLAREEGQQIKTLAAIYFLLTGKKPCPKPASPTACLSFSDALRRQYHAALSAQESYERLADASSPHACAMRKLALEKARQAQTICALLQSCL